MHATICVCTYRRARWLAVLLRALDGQATGGRFTFSIVVADNDAAQSAWAVVREHAAQAAHPVSYRTELRRSIALARNAACAAVQGEFAAWIDDDEVPSPGWLASLMAMAGRSGAAGVLGPVRPRFTGRPPQWLVAGRFCERPIHETGASLTWQQCRAGNALVRADVLRSLQPPFRAEFARGGEDVDFFRRAIAQGHRFVWCNEAVVQELVPPRRWSRRYFLKRALLQGRSSARFSTGPAVLKSVAAVPLYAVALPPAVLFGPQALMHVGIRLCGHAGRVLGAVGFEPIGEWPP